MSGSEKKSAAVDLVVGLDTGPTGECPAEGILIYE